MYTVLDYNDKRILRVMQGCTKIFTVDGQIVKVPESGIVLFPTGTVIVVSKFLHFVKQQIDMACNKSILHHNATLEKARQKALDQGLPVLKVENIEVDENEKILASLEVVEKI